MELTIAVCDDEPVQIEIIISYIQELNIKDRVEIIESSKGEELLNKIKERKIDIVFLDIEMEGIDGINLGRKIREKYKDCIIVFITGFKDHALEAFDINAFNYILKPITKERFKKCMEDIILRLEEKRAFEEKSNVFILSNNKDNIIKLRYEEIYYFEKSINKVKIYTIKHEYEYYGTLKNLKKELNMEKNFIQCHQGYIVNVSKITELKDGEIYMRDIKRLIPVSRRHKVEVRRILEENIFS